MRAARILLIVCLLLGLAAVFFAARAGLQDLRASAVDQIRRHILTQDMTIHDHQGKVLDVDRVLSEAVTTNQCSATGWATAVGLVLVGILLCAGIAYFLLF